MTFYLLHSGQTSAERLARQVPGLVPIQELRTVTADDIVIRYGNTDDPDRGHWVVNRRESLLLAESRRAILKSLRRAGVNCPRNRNQDDETELRTQLVRHYRVPVFNLKALACFRTDAKTVWLSKRINQVLETFAEVAMEHDEESSKVCLLAVRSIHAMGLEFGLVSIGVTVYQRLMVLDVAAAPVCKGRVLQLYAEAVSDYLETEERIIRGEKKSIMLGTDLEFMLRSKQGKMVLASRYFPTRGSVGCDDRTFAGDRMRRPLAELRPRPARTPEQLCANIKVTLREAGQLTKRMYPKWVAGSAPFERFPIGGHIHFSGVPFTGRIVNLLDVYVGLPMMLIEDPLTAVRRRPKYGFLGDVRHKSYGGFEYRTPASFVVDPTIALGALALAYIVAQHHEKLPCPDLHSSDRVRAFYRNDRDYLLPLSEEVYTHVQSTDTYADYKAAIDLLFSMIRNDEVWDEMVDLRTAWQIPVVSVRATAAKARGGQAGYLEQAIRSR